MNAAANAQLADWIAWLEQLNPDRIELGLQRVRCVWEQLERRIDSTVITVGGTNGKGSVVAMLEQVLLAAGHGVVAYTSPHLQRFNERIRINASDVDDIALVHAFNRVAAAQTAAAIKLTYFEFTTLAALWLITEQQPEVALLEVGLGGRLDAVNIIDADAAVITSIGLDHMQWLGNTRAAIAAEKVAIARPGRLLVCGEPDPPTVISRQAAAQEAQLLQIGADFALEPTTDAVTGADQYRFTADWLLADLGLPQLAMPGQHQRNNSACVLTLLTAPQSPLVVNDLPAAVTSLAGTSLIGRQQVLRQQPLLLLDVAHNEQSVAALVATLQSAACHGRTWIVLAMLADKDINAVVHELRPIADHWLLPEIPAPRALQAQRLRHMLLTQGVAAAVITLHEDVLAATNSALQQAQSDDRIVVLGSFITAAALLTHVELIDGL